MPSGEEQHHDHRHHTHVVSSDKRHTRSIPAPGMSTEVSNDIEDLIADGQGRACPRWCQPNGTTASITPTSATSARQYAPRTVAVGFLIRQRPMPRTKLSYWSHEQNMRGVRLQSQAEADDPRCDALWQRAAATASHFHRRWRSAGEGGTHAAHRRPAPRCAVRSAISRLEWPPPTRPP